MRIDRASAADPMGTAYSDARRDGGCEKIGEAYLRWSLSLRLCAEELRHIDVVPMLLALTGHFADLRERNHELFVILAELFNNALDHGLLRLDSATKLDAGGMEAYLELRAQRLAALIEGSIEITLERCQHNQQSWLAIGCCDSGPGFDVRQISDAAPIGATEKPFGRGLALVRSICKEVAFNEAGNRVTAFLAIERNA